MALRAHSTGSKIGAGALQAVLGLLFNNVWILLSGFFDQSYFGIGCTPRTSFPTAPKKGIKMAYVVTAPCFGCKYTDCVVVCPTECFHEGDQMLYIDPQECIDCDACLPECPVEAIFHEDDVPKEWQDFIQLNEEMVLKTPSITERKAPLVGD